VVLLITLKEQRDDLFMGREERSNSGCLLSSFFSGLFLLLLAGSILLLVGSNLWTAGSTHLRVFDSLEELPENRVGLILGTTHRLPGGRDNPHFESRVDAAAELWKAGKVKFLIASGDNESKQYNEPQKMEKALIERGVPKEAIQADYAGFRTLDSVVRAKEVFGEKEITIISEDFHIGRALFIADHKGLEAIGFIGEKVPFSRSSRTRWREKFARVKAVLDLFIFKTEPKYLGEMIKIGETAS